MSGVVFNIQKFSLHDGPGIRTVVFFKGCPLACKWCANPESQNARVQILADHQKCVLCNSCVNNCPTRAIRIKLDKIHIDHTRCINCLQCVNTCPSTVLQVEGKQQNVEDVMKVILQDKDFYEESGGGITLSGGEVLTQPQFALEIINACKKENITVAMETTGYASLDVFKKVIQDVDLLLFDIKHHDSSSHYKGTFVKNETIIENLTYAHSIKKNIIARIPIIPNFNDSIEDAHAFAKLLISIGIHEINLLPFHQFGSKKYEMMNLVYEMKDTKQLYPEDLEEYKQTLLTYGLHVYF